MKLIISVLVTLCYIYGASAKCVMRGECIEINGFAKACPFYDDAPNLLLNLTEVERSEVRDIVSSRCPFLMYDEDGNLKMDEDIVSCCNHVQVKKMEESLMLAEGILGRCPTCFRNFVRQICEMNCSPDQSRFVDVTIAVTNDIEYVNEVDYRMHEDFMLNAHASCSGVIVPQTGLPAINLMCGNAAVCDAEAWFGFTGDAQNNPMVPVQVNFLKWPTEEDSMHVRAPPCDETIDGDLPCSCVDCLATCPVGNEPVLTDICAVVSVNCVGFSIGIVVFVISVTIFSILTLLEYKRLRNGNKPSDDTKEVPKDNFLNKFFQEFFAAIGAFSANNPVLIIMLTTWVIFGMLYGVVNLNLTANPLELWSAPDSRSRAELNYFNSRFGPFYRAAQVYLKFTGLESFEVDSIKYGPAFRIEALRELVVLEDAIINIGRNTSGVVLEDVCYAPLRSRNSEKRLDQCVSMSATVYLGNDRHNINNATYLNTIQNCLNNYLALNCMAEWGGGAEPDITFGGFDPDNILTANTLLINFPITNYLLDEDLEPVLEWEQKFIDLLHDYEENWKSDFVQVAFGTERSIEDEIERVSRAEAVPIVVSYILMFIYVIIALGNVRNCKTWFIDSKITVAISCIIVVLTSIFCAMGVMGYAKITATLLAINVIPFFILSVGIDNVFLMVNTLHDVQCNLKSYDDYNENLSPNKKRAFVFTKMMQAVGPSMFVTSITQITCFAIGSLANFPAVVTFAIFASLSLSFLFIFQVTTVVAILSIDYKRASQNRFDLVCCVRKKILNDSDPLNADTLHQSVFTRLMEPYAKFLLNWRVKIVVVIIFFAMLSMSIVLIPQLEIGLDQEMALPPDSYVYRYLQAVNELLRLGPPVYFVLKSGLNFTDPNHQNVICGGQLCYDDSLTTQIFLASRHSDITFIARSSNSWLDDFFDWTSLPGSCCKYNSTDGGFCQSTDNSPECQYCTIDRHDFGNGLRPHSDAFDRYLPFFLQDTPTDTCNKGGLASYSSHVNYVLDQDGRATVYDSSFMSYHVALGTSSDYISAVKYGYEVSENITMAIKQRTGLDVEVFPYAVFYVFYEQYLTMWADTFASLGFCLIGALAINLLASGFNVVTSLTVMFTAIMVVLNMMGVMYIWSIPLNAVSCVNLIVSIGISVEFCSHIAYAFATSKCQPNERIPDAIKKVGATIITGITFTNIPIIVLAFSYTEIIEVFFFRMLFSLVILGFLHGMVFYPVFLSYVSDVIKK